MANHTPNFSAMRPAISEMWRSIRNQPSVMFAVQRDRPACDRPTNRSLCLSYPQAIPHSPTLYVILAWWTSSPGTRATSSGPPDSSRPPPAGDASVPAGLFSSFILASPGRRPFLPGPLSPPLSYIPYLCNGPNGPKGPPSNKKANPYYVVLVTYESQCSEYDNTFN